MFGIFNIEYRQKTLRAEVRVSSHPLTYVSFDRENRIRLTPNHRLFATLSAVKASGISLKINAE